MSKILISCGWDDVPHLDEKAKDELRKATPEHLIEAREFGKPAMGAGAIYPISEASVFVKPFEVPAIWPRAFAADVGWNRTAFLYGAHDRGTDTIYVYHEHYMGETKPVDHVGSVKGCGLWVPGWMDPAANGRSQTDGVKLMKTYKKLGLNIKNAKNEVETGLMEVRTRLMSGRLKIFTLCENTRREYRIYRRDEKGKVIKENDHAMDALRYLIMSPLLQWKAKPLEHPRGMFTTPKFGDV